jgi:hypothetical protein
MIKSRRLHVNCTCETRNGILRVALHLHNWNERIRTKWSGFDARIQLKLAVLNVGNFNGNTNYLISEFLIRIVWKYDAVKWIELIWIRQGFVLPNLDFQLLKWNTNVTSGLLGGQVGVLPNWLRARQPREKNPVIKKVFSIYQIFALAEHTL